MVEMYDDFDDRDGRARRARLRKDSAARTVGRGRDTSKAANLRKTATDLLAEAQRLDSRPKEPLFEDGTGVVLFVKQFEAGVGIRYTYGGCKTLVGWYVTGQNAGTRMSWDEVLDFIEDRADTYELWIPTGLEQVL
jgi:hypothetical protein